MNENRQYRNSFRRDRIPRIYRPWMHVYFNGGTLLALVIGSIAMIQTWGLGQLAVFAFTLLLGNFTVWLVHRYPLHRRNPLISFPYDPHTVVHHRYFTNEFITCDDNKDLFAVFFPMWVVLGFAVIVQPVFYFSFKFFFGSNLAYTFTAGTAFYFLLYEFVHWTSHLPLDHFLLKNPWLLFMRNHHIIHHDPKLMMKYNFCIVYPLMDIIFGTYYRKAK